MAIGQEPRRRFLTIKDGKFNEKHETGVNAYSFFEGHLMKITFKEHQEYGKQIELHVIDAENYFVLGMYLNSYPAKAFLMMVKNLFLADEMRFTIRQTMKDGKPQVSFFIAQDGLAAKWYFTRDNQRDLPPAVETMVRNKEGQLIKGWDDSERLAYLENMVRTDIMPVLDRRANPFPYHEVYKPQSNNTGAQNSYQQGAGYSTAGAGSMAGNTSVNDITEPLDDLPF